MPQFTSLILIQPEKQAPSPPQGGGGRSRGPADACSGMGGMLPMLAVMFAVFYFLMIRPQQKRQRETQAMLGGLKKGDRVVTSGGLIGRISGMTDRLITIEVAEKVRVQVLRSDVRGIDKGDGETKETKA